MQTEALMEFKSHVAGKNADVAIYTDRIEWSQTGLMKGRKGSDMIPIAQVTSISSKKAGFAYTNVTVITSGNTVDFRVSHKEADGIKNTLTQLLLGSHPAQETQTAATPPPAPQGASVAPPAPGTPAGWIPDPHGRHELRYWDGGRWTEHVSTAGEQTTDAP